MYSRRALLLLVAALPTSFLGMLYLHGTGSKDWSIWQLWLSIRGRYFFEDPVLYLTQQTVPPIYEPRRLGLTLEILLSIGIAVAIAYVLYVITRLLIMRPSSAAILKPEPSDSVFMSLSGRRWYQEYKYTKDKHDYTLLLRGNTVLIISSLVQPVPHVIIDAKSSQQVPFLGHLAKRITNAVELVNDGVSSHYFSVYTASNNDQLMYAFINMDFMGELVKHSRATDIELSNNQVVMAYTVATIRQLGTIDDAIDEAARIIQVVEYNQRGVTIPPEDLALRISIDNRRQIRRSRIRSGLLVGSFILWGALIYNTVQREADTLFVSTTITYIYLLALYNAKLKDLL
jgi:hypothetical protein